ncbi:MAG: glycosyltransferase family 39 protein [Vulcanimicrobiaceae bacterium]
MRDTSLRLAWVATALVFFAHLIANPHYGFFRDELYFIICGRHPAWGYVDQPPLVPLIAAGTQLFGTSLVALRASAALCAAASVFVTMRLAAQLGGGRFAQAFAALVAALTPVLIAFGAQVGPDMIGLWLWPLAALYVLRIVDGASPRLWPAVGAALGVSFEAKYSVLFFAFALVIGLVLTSQRRILATPWFAFGALLAIAIALPNAIWQLAHGLPMLAVLRADAVGENVALSPLAYLVQQLLITNPLLAWVWILGIVVALRTARLRWIGIACLALLAEMIVLHGKNYYPADMYPIPIAIGAAAVARALCARWGRIILVVASFVVASWMVPLAVPILPTPLLIGYTAFLRDNLPLSGASENHRRARLSQDFADMHGWRHLAATVARMYQALPAAERAHTAIIASNYGEASAIAFFDAGIGLPPILSTHNQYWLWGPHGFTGSTLIDVNGRCGARLHAHFYKYSRVIERFNNPLGMPYEDGFPISLCRDPREPLTRIWPLLKNYN